MGLTVLFSSMAHVKDDLLDMDLVSSESFIEGESLAARVFMHPWFVRHHRELRLLTQLILNDYADAEAMVRSQDKWKRQTGDVLRHAAANMMRAIAYLCAEEAGIDPWRHLRQCSPIFREECYRLHHDAEGKPV